VLSLQLRHLPPHASDLRDDWHAYVQRCPGATFFHSLSWMDAVLSTYGHRPCYLMAYRDGRPAGVFPLFAVRSLLAGTILVSVPYAVYGGALCDDAEVAAALLTEARAVAANLRARYIDIRSARPLWPELPTVDRYVTFRKALPASADAVVGSFPRKARAEIRRARDKFKLRACFAEDQLKTVWDLYSLSMRRLGSPNFPLRFFRALADLTPGRHLVSVVYHHDRPIAGLLSFVHGDTVLPYFSGCMSEPAGRMGANNLLYASLMEKASELGLTQFDFGRTRIDNPGPYGFKKNQGFEPTPLGYQYDAPDWGHAPDLTPANRRFRLAQQIWKRLPLVLTRPLGSWLSASIPG